MQIKHIARLGLIGFSTFMAGCISWSNNPNHFNPVKENFKVIAKSSVQRPHWIDTLPEEQANTHFLVGLSNLYATERDARQDAMRHARMEFAQFTGVAVKDVDKLISALYGSSSKVLDATVSGISESSQIVESQVSRIKAKQWYWEKYDVIKNGKQRKAYKCWVLVTVPANEYERVQAWKAQRMAETTAEKQNQISKAREYYEKISKNHQEKLAHIDKLIQQNQPINALRAAKAEWNRLYQKQQDIKQHSEPFQQYLSQLKQAQADSLARVAIIRNGLIIDTGRNSIRYLEKNKNFIPVWLWFDNGKSLQPLRNISLILQSPQGDVLARAQSDQAGKSLFYVEDVIPGSYIIALDSTAGNLQGLDGILRDTLANISTSINLVYPPDPTNRAVKRAIQQLFNEPALGKMTVQRVVFSGITDKSNGQTNPLANTLEKQIQETLLEIKMLELVQADEQQPLENKVDAILAANLDELQNNLLFSLQLNQPTTKRILAASSVNIERPRTTANLQTASPLAPLVTKHNAITIEITSHLGDEQTYVEGDMLSYYVSFNQDAFLLIIYQDASGNLIQIFPSTQSDLKRFVAEEYMEIPGNVADFDLRVTQPFGKETVLAFAASQAFPKLPGKTLPNGLVLLEEKDVNKLVQGLRAYGASTDIAYGEASTTINTVARSAADLKYAIDL